MLITHANLEQADAFYEALIETHRDLTPTQSQELNAKLILLLANHVGQQAVLQDALRIARENTLRG